MSYTFGASVEPVKSGDAVTYTFSTPVGNDSEPFTPTFVSSTTSFAVPAGLSIDSVGVSAASTVDYSSVTATLDGAVISQTLRGSFSMDSTIRPVPSLLVNAHVTAPAGSTVTWMSPIAVDGAARSPMFGTQTSSCTVLDGGVSIGTSTVD